MTTHRILKTVLATLCAGMLPNSLSAQNVSPENAASHITSDYPSVASVPRGYAQYSAKEWKKLIDSYWGPGLPTSQKIQIFDSFCDDVDRHSAAFPNLPVNWDSLKSIFRPEVAAGVSRGRFSAIMSQMSLSLREYFSYISDLGIDSSMNVAGKWRPRGAPVFKIASTCATGLGARLTPQADSSLLVIRVARNGPLNLQPGDVVLGYDRVPWKQLVRQLLEAQIPVGSPAYGKKLWGNSPYYENRWGTSPESWSHYLLNAAAANWHLFDSIDVVKYGTGDTVHLATSKLDVTDWDTFMGFEQLPVRGVSYPVYGPADGDTRTSTYGIVEGTNVGYIYIQAWDEYTAAFVATGLRELTQQKKTDGLIVDFRCNWGGKVSGISALDPLFSCDPSRSLAIAQRDTGGTRMQFTMRPFTSTITDKHRVYDRPIAVLTGPECAGVGDFGAFVMRAHPMARSFGKPTNTAYYSKGSMCAPCRFPLADNWYFHIANDGGYSNNTGEQFLYHKGFDVDERIWFTKDDVAKGDDTIVKRALQWIAELAHGHDVKLAKQYGTPGKDTIQVTATVENPLKHALAVWAYLSDRAGGMLDSCKMIDDGLHNDGKAGDKVYGGSFHPPAKEGVFDVSLRTTDLTELTSRNLLRANAYFTNGPVVGRGWRSSTSDTIPNAGDIMKLRFPLANTGSFDTVRAVSATVTVIDTMLYVTAGTQISYGNLAPGAESSGSATPALKIDPSCSPNMKAKLLLSIESEGIAVRMDTITILVQPAVTSVADNNALPNEYSLSQNYPNPFNPSTTIQYEVPKSANVSLRVFNTLGQSVAVLVDEYTQPGFYQAHWDASYVPSGVYFYRLRAGEYTMTKKMVLLH